MRIKDIIFEGGWDTTKTQNTVLHPKIVGVALKVVDKFVTDFNAWLKQHGHPPVRRGRPTGSSAYHEIDRQQDPGKIYGDIDLQMIGAEQPGQTMAQFTAYWNKLADDFIHTANTPSVDAEDTKPGHPIFKIGKSDYVQIDFMWHPERLEKWGASRVTPEHGVKGLLMGNMFSAFGEILDLSIQHAGVQLKVQAGKHVPFSKQKGVEVITITTNPETYLYDTFMYLAKQAGVTRPTIDPLLKQFPGNDVNDVKIQKIANGIKGFANSCETNKMFGQGALGNFRDADNFLHKFIDNYETKAMIDINSKKRDKAATPQAIARANQDREKVMQGLAMVKWYFQ